MDSIKPELDPSSKSFNPLLYIYSKEVEPDPRGKIFDNVEQLVNSLKKTGHLPTQCQKEKNSNNDY